MSVTAAIIARNEQCNLARCLGSIRYKVDEIVLVDTGSTDDTAAIAGAFGARVLHYTWSDDFAAARNHGLDACKTEWLLYIDADETLRSDTEVTVGHLVNPLWMGADVLFKPKTNYTRYRLTRLFRADPRIRFSGAIHETILPALELAASRDGCSVPVGLTSIKIDHHGYDGDMAGKHVRNLPLLQRCSREHPDRVYYWFHLVETFLGLGRFQDAMEAGRQGIAAARRRPGPKNSVDAAMICQMLSVALLYRGADPLALLEEGFSFCPGEHGLRLTLARRELENGDPSAALTIALELQRVDTQRLEPGILAHDHDIFGRLAKELEVACLLRLGRAEEAGQVLRSSAGVAPRGPDQG